MRYRLALALALAIPLACGPATRAPTPGTAAPTAETTTTRPLDRLVAVDVFDTDPQTSARVLARHGDALRAMRQDEPEDRVRSLAAKIRTDGGYAYVQIAQVTYPDPTGNKRYVTVDIVSSRDAARRMPFRPAPTGVYPDPQGLIALWDAYEQKIIGLMSRGVQLRPPDSCPSFHCVGDPQHPEVRELTTAMATRVPPHVDELATILRDDGRPEYRANAAYLLAYAADGRAVVARLLPALHDPSELVRNNAMRVLAEIALRHPEIDVPIAPLVEVLTFPATTDRNKAAATLDRLLARDGAAAHYPLIVREAGSTLIALLRLAQPNNHDFAYNILQRISGERHGERDYAAWEAWRSRAVAGSIAN